MFKINLPARKKNGLIIGVANTLVVILVGFLYVGFYYYSGVNQIKDKLMNEASEIVETHIVYKEDRVQFLQDNEIDTIQNDLLTDGLSAIIFNNKREVIGRFGIFDFNEELLKDDKSVNSVVQNTLDSNKYAYSTEIDLYGDNSYESLAYPLVKDGSTVGVILLYAPINYLQDLFRISFYVLALVVPISILLNLAIGQAIAKFAYSPIRKLIEKMNKTNIHNINDKVVPEGNPEDESYLLAVKYNEMLDRVNEGVQKQKQFISNASHELKSPIARAISTLDVVKLDLRKSGETESKEVVSEKIDSVRSELVELGSLINSLLVLSRVKETDGDKVVFNVKDELSAINKKFEKESILMDVEPSMNIFFNVGYFRSLFHNIVENAIKYGVSGSVSIVGKCNGSTYEIVVSNEVSGSIETDYEKLFKRFSTNSKNGFGLGLSIVKGIVEQEGLDMNAYMENERFNIAIGNFKLMNESRRLNFGWKR